MIIYRPALFTHGSALRHVARMMGASGVGLLATFLADIFTVIYVSQLSQPVLVGAVGLAKTLVFLNVAFCSGLVISAGVLLSKAIGESGSRVHSHLIAHLLFLAFLFSLFIVLLETMAFSRLTQWVGADTETVDAAKNFGWMALASCPLLAVSQTCSQVLRASGEVGRAVGVPLSGALSLAIADPIFIFGFEMGLEGAGAALALSATISLACGVWFLKGAGGIYKPQKGALLEHLRQILPIALPATLGNLATPISLTYLMTILATMGASAMAGMAVMDRVMQFAYCFYFAIPSALVPILGQNMGGGHSARVLATLKSAMALVVVYGLTVWFAVSLLAPLAVHHLNLEGAAAEMFGAFGRAGAGLWIIFGLDFVAQAIFLTMGQARWVLIFAWVRGTLGTFPFVYLGAQWQGAPGALMGLWCGNALVSILSICMACYVCRRTLKGI